MLAAKQEAAHCVAVALVRQARAQKQDAQGDKRGYPVALLQEEDVEHKQLGHRQGQKRNPRKPYLAGLPGYAHGDDRQNAAA